MLRLTELLDKSKQLDNIKILFELFYALVEKEIDFRLWLLFEPLCRSEIVTLEEILDSLVQTVFEVPTIHYHFVYEVKLLTFWPFANWSITCLHHCIFHRLLVLWCVVETLYKVMRIS